MTGVFVDDDNNKHIHVDMMSFKMKALKYTMHVQFELKVLFTRGVYI